MNKNLGQLKKQLADKGKDVRRAHIDMMGSSPDFSRNRDRYHQLMREEQQLTGRLIEETKQSGDLLNRKYRQNVGLTVGVATPLMGLIGYNMEK